MLALLKSQLKSVCLKQFISSWKLLNTDGGMKKIMTKNIETVFRKFKLPSKHIDKKVKKEVPCALLKNS